MQLGTWINTWLSLITPIRSPRTIASYKSALAHAPVEFMNKEIEAVDATAWQLAVNQVAAEYPRQAQLLHAALRAGWRYGQQRRVIDADHSPWQFVQAPVHHAKPIVYLTPAEMSSYIRHVQETPAALPLLMMVLLGLRRGEALAIKWSQIDKLSMVLHVDCQIVNGSECRTKSRTSSRKVPICAEILRFFDLYGDKTRQYCYNGGVKQLYASHKKALIQARLSPCTLHGLRHSCATAALAGGAPMTAVQQMLGHAHFSTTADIYSHALLDPQRQAVKQLVMLAG